MEYASSRIDNHRYLSVNGHEVHRRIVGLKERFMAENRSSYGDMLENLADSLISDPLCLTHYEMDIHWSLLSFLLEISKDPIGTLSKGDRNVQFVDDSDVESSIERVSDDLLTSLTQCNIQAPRFHLASHRSELSVS